jgi:hemoglobin/transferrin/lactoferrin receptor protein
VIVQLATNQNIMKHFTAVFLVIFLCSAYICQANNSHRIQMLADSLLISSDQLELDSLDSVPLINLNEVDVYGITSSRLAFPLVIVDKNALQNFSFTTPADALQREPGIFLARDGIWATSVNIRGLSEQRLLFLVDEDRLLTATDIAAALSTVDLNALERIEVIKGAGSVLYGTGAMGGVVNFVPERPTYSPFLESHGNVNSSFNSANQFWSNHAKVQLTNRQWYLSLNGSYRTAQNIRTPEGKLPNSQFNDASWGMQAGMKSVENQELLVNYQHFEAWNAGLPGGSAFPTTAKVRYKDVQRNHFSAEYIFSDLTDYLKRLSLKAYTQNISRDVENIVNNSTSIFPSSNNNTSGIKAVGDWEYTAYNKLTLGVEGWIRDAKTSRIKEVQTSSQINVFGEQPTPNAQVQDAGIFAQYSWEFSPHYWMLNAGIRLDYLKTTNDSAFQPVYKYSYFPENPSMRIYEDIPRSLLFKAGEKNEFSYAAHVDLIFHPTRRQKLALSVSNSYRAPSLEELFKYIDQAGTLRVGNPDLKPEKGIFSNLGYTLSEDHLYVKTDLFANYLFDLIAEQHGTYTYQDENGNVSQRDALINTNIDKALFLGGEIELQWKINPVFSMRTNFSYTQGRNIDKDAFLPQIPPMNGLFSVNYHQKELIDISFSALWAARQGDVAPGENPTAGHLIFNADVHTEKLSMNRNYLQFFAGIENIFDKAYYNHLSTTRGILRLEPGRNIYVKAQLGW